jgi:hypothetical protein
MKGLPCDALVILLSYKHVPPRIMCSRVLVREWLITWNTSEGTTARSCLHSAVVSHEHRLRTEHDDSRMMTANPCIFMTVHSHKTSQSSFSEYHTHPLTLFHLSNPPICGRAHEATHMLLHLSYSGGSSPSFSMFVPTGMNVNPILCSTPSSSPTPQRLPKQATSSSVRITSMSEDA